jgi:hypothetical protein
MAGNIYRPTRDLPSTAERRWIARYRTLIEETLSNQNGMQVTDLRSKIIQRYDCDTIDMAFGRRIRVFAGAIHRLNNTEFNVRPYSHTGNYFKFEVPDHETITYGELYDRVVEGKMPELKEKLGKMAFAIPVSGRDPEFSDQLQDLANEINEDISEACAAFDDPKLYYMSFDDIDPVPDEHVEKVIAGLQRELNRELRSHPKDQEAFGYAAPRRAAAPLAKLPWNVQRALVERRRYRYKQYGLSKKNMETNSFSLWDVPEDPTFIPRRILRVVKERNLRIIDSAQDLMDGFVGL